MANQAITTVDRVVGSGTANRFPIDGKRPYYEIARCQTNQASGFGTSQTANTCGSTFDERYNPSNTGNFRGASRFTLADGLVFTFDPAAFAGPRTT